jgi:hypothetical protein
MFVEAAEDLDQMHDNQFELILFVFAKDAFLLLLLEAMLVAESVLVPLGTVSAVAHATLYLLALVLMALVFA